MSVKILVVDDERNLVNLIRGYLEREGFEIHEALDGNAALEKARSVELLLVPTSHAYLDEERAIPPASG